MKHTKRITSLFLSAMLALSLLPAPAFAAASFPDVQEGSWYYPYVTALAEAGGISGYEDGTFRPNGSLKQIEAAAILLRALNVDSVLGQDAIAQAEASLKSVNGNFWGNPYIARMMLLIGFPANAETATADFWNREIYRIDMALFMGKVYEAYLQSKGITDELKVYQQGIYLIGDYDTDVSQYENELQYYVAWLYCNGIVQGMNENGDFKPANHLTRAECSKMVYVLMHEETWQEIDWEAVLAKHEGKENAQPSSSIDFTGKERTRYTDDVAFDYCRALENQIGIQIFYLPEWTDKPGGVITLEDMEQFTFTRDYFEMVLTELQKMKAAFDCYPDGFLKEVVAKKNNRKTEIILFPGKVDGLEQFGLHVYDETNDKQKVDQVYYTGTGDLHFYSHEMGHMVMSSAAILNGWSETTKEWESIGGIMDYVSAYAMQSRPEDWAETWAFCWHETQEVIEMCRSNPGLLKKVRYMTEILDKNYSTIEAAQLPWAELL